MKKIIYTIIALLLVATACQQKTEKPVFDAATEKAAILANMDKMYAAYTARDVKTFMNYLTDDCVMIGTDPDESWDKAAYEKIMTESFTDTAFKPVFNMIKRDVVFGKDGNSAVAVETMTMGTMTNLPVRNVTFHVKNDSAWLCKLSSFSFLPKNSDLPEIFKVLKK